MLLRHERGAVPFDSGRAETDPTVSTWSMGTRPRHGREAAGLLRTPTAGLEGNRRGRGHVGEADGPVRLTSCGATLARAHARSGDRVAIAASLGSGDVFDRALVTFAEQYADQNEKDHQALVDAIRAGRVPAEAA